MSCFSALVKLLNKSIEGTADDDEEGVTPDTAIRSGLELLKVLNMEPSKSTEVPSLQKLIFVLLSACISVLIGVALTSRKHCCWLLIKTCISGRLFWWIEVTK